ncbi:MAG TPA: acyl-CoA dehydrogenase family protein [Polyangiaceae bacterium]
MDFAYTEGQSAVAALARRIFDERLGAAAMKALEATEPERFDREAWKVLASSGLLGTGIAEVHGGAGQGFLEVCALLEEAGAAVAPLPLWETLVLGAMPIAHAGRESQQRRWLPGVVAGEVVLTAALAEPDGTDPMHVATTARMNGGTWRLDGAKTCVPHARVAQRILVPARTGASTLGLFLVAPDAAGVTLERQVATTGDPQYRVVLDGAHVSEPDVLGDPSRGADTLSWLLPRATIGLCAMELGVAARALAMTASYTTTRQQFDRPIATFQAVAQRAADAYVDVESIRVTTWEAAWRLSEGLDAAEAVSTAKLFAAEAGHRVAFAAQHLHGGMGFDVEYPLYRYYLRSKLHELTLGSASVHLERLGRLLAAG